MRKFASYDLYPSVKLDVRSEVSHLVVGIDYYNTLVVRHYKAEMIAATKAKTQRYYTSDCPSPIRPEIQCFLHLQEHPFASSTDLEPK